MASESKSPVGEKPQFDIVFSATPAQVLELLALYQREWRAKNWFAERTLDSLKFMLAKTAKLLVLVVRNQPVSSPASVVLLSAPAASDSGSVSAPASSGAAGISAISTDSDSAAAQPACGPADPEPATAETKSPTAIPVPAKAADEIHRHVLAFGVVTGDLADPLLEDIIVDEKFRGFGLGALVLNTILGHEILKLARAPRIDLYCRPRLIPFYEKFGFRAMREPINDKVLMRKPLAWSAPSSPSEPAPAPGPCLTVRF